MTPKRKTSRKRRPWKCKIKTEIRVWGWCCRSQEDKDNSRRMAPEVRGSRTLGTWQHRAMNRNRAGAGNGHWLGCRDSVADRA